MLLLAPGLGTIDDHNEGAFPKDLETYKGTLFDDQFCHSSSSADSKPINTHDNFTLQLEHVKMTKVIPTL